MKRLATIAAVIFGTLIATAALSSAGEKETKTKFDYKHDFKHDDCHKDFCDFNYFDFACDDYYLYYYSCFGYDYFDCDHYCHDGSCHHGCGHDGTTTTSLPVIGNNPPGVPPHEGPQGTTSVWQKGGLKGITVLGNVNTTTNTNPFKNPVFQKGANGLTAYGTLSGKQPTKPGSGRPPVSRN